MRHVLIATFGVLAFVALACAGGDETTAPAAQEPAAAAQPAASASTSTDKMETKPSDSAMASSMDKMAIPGPTALTPTEPGHILTVANQIGANSFIVAGDETPKPGQIATFGVRRDPPAAFDMMMTTIWYDLHQVGSPVWGSGNLVRPCLENVYAVCPALASEWEHNADFTQWTFTIRDGVKWHDGTAFTVEDAKFWFDLAFTGYKSGDKVRRPAWYATKMGKFRSAEIVGGNQLRITLEERNPLFAEILKTPYFTFAHPRHLVQPKLDEGTTEVAPLDVNLMGTGPYMLEGEYERGVIARVRKNDAYWEKDAQGRQLPYLDGMDFAIMSNPEAMDAAIRVGRLDGGSPGGGYTLSRERYDAYKNDLGDQFYAVQVSSAGPSAGSGLAFNVLKEGPWQDVRVRRAMSLWLDRQQAITAVGGFGVLGGLLNPSNPFSNTDVNEWPGYDPATKAQDREEAKRLLAEAGYAGGGFTMNYNCLTTTTWRARCVFLNAQLAELGIELKLDLMDVATWKEAGQSLNYAAIQSAAGVVSYIPEANEAAMSRFSVSPGAFVKHEDVKVDEYFSRLKSAITLDQRIAVWKEFEKYWLLEQVYSASLSAGLTTIPYRTWTKGRIMGPEEIMAYMDFATVWLDK